MACCWWLKRCGTQFSSVCSIAVPQCIPSLDPLHTALPALLAAQVESTKVELAQQQKALADAQAAKAAAEQQLDRLTQHLDDTEAQLQDAK